MVVSSSHHPRFDAVLRTLPFDKLRAVSNVERLRANPERVPRRRHESKSLDVLGTVSDVERPAGRPVQEAFALRE